MSQNVSPMTKCCSSATEEMGNKKILLEYLYLDLDVCNRCIGTEQVLDEVVTTLTPAIQLGGFEVEYRKIKMETPELAQQYQFESSPTIRINGKDICLNVQENPCDCCSDISGTNVDCRTFEYKGQSYEVPPKEMLAEVILQAVFSSTKEKCCADGEYALPENLEVFYKGKTEKSDCGCGSGCCN